MRLKTLAIAILIVTASPHVAVAQMLLRNEGDYRQFVDRYLCIVTSYLTGLSKSQLTRNQFIILSPKDDPSKYVQCLFRPGQSVYCEATSYYFRNPPGGLNAIACPMKSGVCFKVISFHFNREAISSSKS